MNRIRKHTIVDIGILEHVVPVVVFAVGNKTELDEEGKDLDVFVGDGCPFCESRSRLGY